MNCPVCNQALVVVERESIELDWCLSCRGFWFDEGELELLAEKTGRRLEPEDVGHGSSESGPGKSRKCPRCKRRMERKAVGARDPVLEVFLQKTWGKPNATMDTPWERRSDKVGRAPRNAPGRSDRRSFENCVVDEVHRQVAPIKTVAAGKSAAKP